MMGMVIPQGWPVKTFLLSFEFVNELIGSEDLTVASNYMKISTFINHDYFNQI